LLYDDDLRGSHQTVRMNRSVTKLFAEAAVSRGSSQKLLQDQDKALKPVIIKKYANRRLYNTETSSYVTLEDLGEMVRRERDFLVYDAKTGEDLTHSVLTQIIVEEEGKGQNLLPIGFLRQLIRFYGHSIEHLVPKYLEFSLETLTREQEKYHKQFADTFGGAAFEAIQEQARQNMALFERAITMFAPFARKEQEQAAARKEEQHVSGGNDAPRREDFAELKAQLAAMQAQLDRLEKMKTGNSGGEGK
jgi:polyhydroxyalkanoate synthesis repressor PhaR